MKIFYQRFLLYTTLPFVLFGCRSDNLTGTEGLAATFFPLHVGNTWVYTHMGSTATITYQVYAKKVIGTHLYYQFGSSQEYADWLRIDGGKVYRLENNTDVLWLDFNRQDGDQYNYPQENTSQLGGYVVTVRRDQIKEYELEQKYKYTDCVNFFFDIPQAVDDEHGYIFAPGIGIVNFYGAWVNLYLESWSIAEE
ncbi:MAG: hypothetical protein H6696_06510 [Deferribacteres bacterium]|nr:hypothetical protein [candidate division KSB1 bacterium]MCB9501572.1 hypothetical protein [Deferribacteres bacterium]